LVLPPRHEAIHALLGVIEFLLEQGGSLYLVDFLLVVSNGSKENKNMLAICHFLLYHSPPLTNGFS